MQSDLNTELLSRYAPRKGRYALLPSLTPRQQVALLCRVLHRGATTITSPAMSRSGRTTALTWPIRGN